MGQTVTQSVACRMVERLPEVVQRLVELYRAEVPEYASLTDEVLQSEVLPVTRMYVDLFFSALAAGRLPQIAEVPGLEETGRRRLEMAVPLEAILHVYRIAGRGVFEALVEVVEPGEERALGEIGPRWMDFIDHGASRTASGYLRAAQEQVRRVEARRGAVLQALLAADDAAEVAAVAAEFSLALARTYVPVATPGEDAVSRLDGLVHRLPADSLVGARGRRLLILCPEIPPDVGRLRAELDVDLVVFGRAVAPGAALRAEVEQVERVLRLAVARGVNGTLTSRDLLLEQVVAADTRLGAQLCAVVEPLVQRNRSELLVSTLRTYLATGSAATTAAREAAHPNTVTYRLRRVTELTGLDPRVPAEATVLVLGLAAEEQRHPDRPL